MSPTTLQGQVRITIPAEVYEKDGYWWFECAPLNRLGMSAVPMYRVTAEGLDDFIGLMEYQNIKVEVIEQDE